MLPTDLAKQRMCIAREAGERAAWSGCSAAQFIRDAIRTVVLKPRATGPVATWDGEPNRTSIEHDTVHNDP
jgi:hypothetical protein